MNQVIVLAREAMKKAVEENESQAAEASGVSNELKPGVTVDLSRRNIQKLPEEVVDIIKDQLERYVARLHVLIPWVCKDSRTRDTHQGYNCGRGTYFC